VRWRQKLGRSVCICVYPRAIVFSDTIRNVDTKFRSPQSPLTKPWMALPQPKLARCIRSCPTVIQVLPVAGVHESSSSATRRKSLSAMA